MEGKKGTKKFGRPLKEIDKKQFEYLCSLQCTEEEIAGFFECDVDTITNWCKRTYNTTFSEIYKVYSSRGKISLRRYQMQLAEKNPSMAIWLGKQQLGQTDNIVVTANKVDDDEITKAIKEKLGKK